MQCSKCISKAEKQFLMFLSDDKTSPRTRTQFKRDHKKVFYEAIFGSFSNVQCIST